MLLRSNPWSDGDGLDYGRARGGAVAGDLEEFYGRAMPAPPARIREEDFVFYSIFEWQERKGPAETIEAFLRALPEPASVVLVLKVNPGAAGIHGFHFVKTIVKFDLENRKIENMKVIEMGKRA